MLNYKDMAVQAYLPEDWDEVKKALLTQYVLFDHKVRVELRFDGLRQRSNLQSFMNEFQKVDAALSFAEVSISDERKVLIFIWGLHLPEDRRYILQQKCSDLDEVCEAGIFLWQSTVWEGSMTSNRGGRGDQGKHRGDQDEGQERRMKKLEGRPRGRPGSRACAWGVVRRGS